MVLLSDKIDSSKNNNNSLSISPSELILKKIKQASVKKRTDKDEEQKQIPEKTLEKSNKNKDFLRNGKKNMSLEDSYIKKINTVRNTIRQEIFYAKQCRKMKEKQLIEQSSTSKIQESNPESELYNKRRSKNYSLENNDSDDNDDNETMQVQNVLHLKKPLVNKENEAVYYNNYGRMEPIDWSILHNEKKNTPESNNLKISENHNMDSFDEIRKTSKTIPEANVEFINFVNNTMTDETVYNKIGNIEKIYNATDSQLVKIQRMIESYDETDITITSVIKKAFQPCEPKLHVTNLIDLKNDLLFLKNEKDGSKNKCVVEHNIKTSNSNICENDELNKFQFSHKCEDSEKNILFNTEKKRINEINELKDIDDEKLEKAEASSSFNLVKSNKSKINTNNENTKSEIHTKNSFFNRLKRISDQQSIFSLDSDNLSKTNSNSDISINRYMNEYQLEFKKCNETDNTTYEQKINVLKTELKNNEILMRETFTQACENSINNVIDKNIIKNKNDILNKETLKSTKSQYFLRLSNLVEKLVIENKEESKNNTNKKASDNSIAKSNIKYMDKTEDDQNSFLSVNNKELPASIKNVINSENILPIEISKLKNESLDYDLVPKTNLNFDNNSIDSEEEYDFVNFEQFGPFVDLLNNLKNITDAQKAAVTDIMDSENLKFIGKEKNNLNSINNLNLKNLKNIKCQTNAPTDDEFINEKKTNDPMITESKRRRKVLDALKNYETKNTSIKGDDCQQFVDKEQNLITNTLKDRHWILNKIKRLNLHTKCKTIDETTFERIKF